MEKDIMDSSIADATHVHVFVCRCRIPGDVGTDDVLTISVTAVKPEDDEDALCLDDAISAVLDSLAILDD